MSGFGKDGILRWIGVLVFAALLVSIYLLSDRPANEQSRTPGKEESLRKREARPDLSHGTSQADKPVGSPVVAGDDVTFESFGKIRTALDKLRECRDPDQAALILRALRTGLLAEPEDESVEAIVAFLESGEDAVTGLPFVVGPDGVMAVVPTLRTALMDLLPTLDPLVALDVARDVMKRRSSQDEYALALRNMAWNDLDGDMREELGSRLKEMLEIRPWLENPSSGFLEAFDVALEIGGPGWFSALSDVAENGVAGDKPELSKAAFVALDRMVLRDPSLLVTAGFGTGWMDFAPKPRAALMSRVDVTQPEQRALFVEYLNSGSHGPGELEYFADLFPNGNILHGHRLVTADEETPSIAGRQALDRRFLEVVETLLKSASGPAKETLIEIETRLRGYVRPE